jgi:O-antigen ligase
MAFTFVLLVAPQAHLPALRPFRLALVAAVVAIAARIVDCLARGLPLAVRRPEMAFTAGIVAWAVVTLPLSSWPGGSVSFLLNGYFKTVAVFWLLGNVVDTLPRLAQAAWALTWLSVPLALTGIRNYLSGAFIEAGHGVRRIEGYDAGLTGNPNDLALMLNLILPLSLALLVAARRASVRAALIAIVALQAGGVIVTFSRAGFLTLGVVFAAYLWRLLRRGRRGFAAVLLAVALAGLAALPAGYAARLATIADMSADVTGSAQSRWSDMAAGVRFVLEHPVFGAGIGMNTLALNALRGPEWMAVHNVYLEYAMELGLPGLALFVLLVVSCLRTVRRVRQRTQDVPALAELSWLAEGLQVGILAFAAAAFFYPVAYNFYFYYLAGLAVAAGVLADRALAGAAADRPRVEAAA